MLYPTVDLNADITSFCSEDLLTPVVKLMRHPTEDIYQQAGAIIDYVQGMSSYSNQNLLFNAHTFVEKSPDKVLQSGYLEELLMTLAKANRYSAPYRRLTERFKKVPALYPGKYQPLLCNYIF